jgi:hypothetical protein
MSAPETPAPSGDLVRALEEGVAAALATPAPEGAVTLEERVTALEEIVRALVVFLETSPQGPSLEDQIRQSRDRMRRRMGP